MINNSSLDNTSRVNAGTGDANGGFSLQLPFWFTVFQISLQIAIGVFGVAGNVLVCAMIITRTTKFSALNPYLLSLAFADLGILLFNHPIAVLKIHFPDKWLLGKVACLYIAPFTETFFGASIWTITAIACERYLKIAWKIKKIRFGETRSLKRTLFIIIAIWVISFAVTSMPHNLYAKYNSETKKCSSNFSPTFRRSVITINATILYVLPLSIIAFSYQRISKRVSQRSKSLLVETPLGNGSLESSRSNARALLQQTRKTQRILKPLVILFAVTMLPLHMLTFTLVYWSNYQFVQSYFLILFTIVNISIGINAAADPLVYCVVNEDFRQGLIAVLSRCFRCQQTESRVSRYSSGRSTGQYRGTVESKVLDKDETEL